MPAFPTQRAHRRFRSGRSLDIENTKLKSIRGRCVSSRTRRGERSAGEFRIQDGTHGNDRGAGGVPVSLSSTGNLSAGGDGFWVSPVRADRLAALGQYARDRERATEDRRNDRDGYGQLGSASHKSG